MQLDFGCKLCSLRKSKRMTYAQLAEKSGLSVAFIITLEKGKKSPTLRTLEKLANALGVKITDFIEEKAG